jgi:hypothetical protein
VVTAYNAFMAEKIAQEIKSIEDPYLLSIYLRAIQYQRCRIGGAKEGSCKGCLFRCENCRSLNTIADFELEAFSED